jgi:hypothetical protein
MSGKILTALVLALAASTNVSAQTDSAAGKGLTVMGIISLPQGDFADEDGGGATMGFGAGLEYAVPMKNSKNLQFVVGGYYIRNPMDVSDIEDEDVTVDADGWSNFGVLGGVRMTDLAGISGFYAQGMAGFNMATAGDIEMTDDYYGETLMQTSSTETSLAISLGVGRKFGKWDIGVRYLNFGEPEFEVKIEDGDGYELAEGEIEQKISMFALTVGYAF